MNKNEFYISSGVFEKETMTFIMGKHTYQVKEKVETIRHKEREYAGNGWYYQNKVWTESTRVTHTVWDNDEYIGKIIEGSSVKFKDPKRHQIKVKRNQNVPTTKKQ